MNHYESRHTSALGRPTSLTSLGLPKQAQSRNGCYLGHGRRNKTLTFTRGKPLVLRSHGQACAFDRFYLFLFSLYFFNLPTQGLCPIYMTPTLPTINRSQWLSEWSVAWQHAIIRTLQMLNFGPWSTGQLRQKTFQCETQDLTREFDWTCWTGTGGGHRDPLNSPRSSQPDPGRGGWAGRWQV